MDQLGTILSVAGTVVGLLITTLTFVLKFIKNAKARKAAERLIAMSNALLPYIKQAELFTSFSGQEKKAYVMTAANQYAINHGITFDVSAISEKIEELVALTKSVNKRDRDAFCTATSTNASEYAKCMQCQENEVV